MSATPKEVLLRQLENVDKMPTLSVTLVPLLRYLEQPIDRLDVQQIVDLISQDKSLTAQCLHMANSPLFGRWQRVDSIRSAVVSLGLQRMRDIALSCSVLTLLPMGKSKINPMVFWEHALGCALVSRQFARKIQFSNPEKAYLAGLLHDIGIVAHIWLLPEEFQKVLDLAQSRHVPLHEVEQEVLGMDHTATGRIVAERWCLPADLLAVVSSHHDLSTADDHRSLVAVIALSDLLCRMSGLGYGYAEDRQVDFLDEPGFEILSKECPGLQAFDWARFTLEMEAYMEEVRRLVNLLYRPS